MFRITSLLSLPLLLSACAPEPCTVSDNEDGSYTLSCPDGTDATLRDGEDGTDGTDGTDGADGADGADGSNGADGADGEDGISWLMRTEVEPEGENCPNGGIAVHAGPDTNADGSLGEDEIATTEYVCDGADGNTLHAHLRFPSTTSTLYDTSSSSSLGDGGGGRIFRADSYVEQTFERGAPFEELTSLTYAFVMSDLTSSGCSDDTNNFDILINGTKVGDFAFDNGTGGSIAFVDTVDFDPIEGSGATGTHYTLRLEALDTVCSGNGSYNWFPGGQFIVAP